MFNQFKLEKCCIITCPNTSLTRKLKYIRFPLSLIETYKHEPWMKYILIRPRGRVPLCFEHFASSEPHSIPKGEGYVAKLLARAVGLGEVNLPGPPRQKSTVSVACGGLAPGGTSPVGSAPGGLVPDSSAPGTSPVGSASGVSVTGSSAPGTSPVELAPGGTAPGGSALGSTCPVGSALGNTSPVGSALGSSAPGGSDPGGSDPGVMAPGGSDPGVMAPGGLAPGGSDSGVMAPGGLAPSDMAPGGSAPGGMATGAIVPGGMAPFSLAPELLDWQVKQFALRFITYDALLERPSKANASKRKTAYVALAKELRVNVATVRARERRFRTYFDRKVAALLRRNPSKPLWGAPRWVRAVEKRLHVLRALLYSQSKPARQLNPRTVSPGAVVSALCAAARTHQALCSTMLYTEVKRALGLNSLSTGLNDLHAVWVSAQRVSLEQVVCAGRAGDRTAHAAPPDAALVADLVLLHTDVEVHRLVTDESVNLYEESLALHLLWQLVQRHRLEEAAPKNSHVMAQRWTRAYNDYLNSDRVASLIVLQRRWHELKLQARARLAAHWRRRAAAPGPHGPTPAPIHLAVINKYPSIVTNLFKSWRQQVLDGLIIAEPLKSEMDGSEEEHTEEPTTKEPTGKEKKDLSGKETMGQACNEGMLHLEDETNEQSDQTGDMSDYSGESSADDDVTLPPRLTRSRARAVGRGTKDDNSPVQQIFKQNEDTDTEDNLVIDECVAKYEQTEHIESIDSTQMDSESTHMASESTQMDSESTHTASESTHMDTESTHLDTELTDMDTRSTPIDTKLREVLETLDPSQVKSEIVFESDEENDPYLKDTKAETQLDIKHEPKFISNRLVFEDELPSACGVTADVTGDVRWDAWNSEQGMDELPEDRKRGELVFDAKLLMTNSIKLVRIDQTHFWTKYSHQNISIDTSRVDSEQLIPHSIQSSAAKNKLNPFKIDNSMWNKVANNANVRQLYKNIKKELIEDDAVNNEKKPSKIPRESYHTQTASEESDEPVSNFAIATESDPAESEDESLEQIQEDKTNVISPKKEKISPLKRRHSKNSDIASAPSLNTKKLNVKKRIVTRSETKEEPDASSKESESSDEEWPAEKQEIKSRKPNKKQKNSHFAASTLEWSDSFASALGPRRAPRVLLPDRESVRRANSAILTAQVAPSVVPANLCLDSAWSAGSDAAPAAAAVPTQEELCVEQSLPSAAELQIVLHELATVSTAEQVMDAAQCCAARRHRVVNDARRRIGFPEIPLHNHGAAACSCCCAHLCDTGARRRVQHQLQALHRDINNMLKAAANVSKGKKTGDAAPKRMKDSSRKSSSSPFHRAAKPATTATPAKTVSKAKPSPRKIKTGAKTPSAKPAAAKNPSSESSAARKTPAKPCTSAKDSRSVKPSTLAKSSRSKSVLKSNEQTTSAKPSPPTTVSSTATPTTSSKLSAPGLADGYDEWQRQKTLNAQYFHFSSMKSAKEKSTATTTSTTKPKCTTPSAIPQTNAATSLTNTTPPLNYTNPSTNTLPTDLPSQPNEATLSTTTPPTTATTTILLPVVEAAPLQHDHLRPAILRAAHNLCKPTTTTASKSFLKHMLNIQLARHKGIPECVPIASKPTSRDYKQNPANRSLLKPIQEYTSETENIQTGNILKGFPNITLVPLEKLTDKNPSSLSNPVARPEDVLTQSSSLLLAQQQQQLQVSGNQSTQGNVLQSPPAEMNVSILEQYSRTLKRKGTANAKPFKAAVNALTLRQVGPEGPQTTIIMAVSLPTEHLLRKALVSATPETIDLTEPDPIDIDDLNSNFNNLTTEPSSNLTTESSNNLTTEPNSNMTTEPCSNLTTELSSNLTTESSNNLTTEPNSNMTTEPCSNLTTEPNSNLTTEPNSNLTTETSPIRVYSGPSNTRRAGPKGPQIMSLSSKIHDGDVIEIDDSSTDSEQSSHSAADDKTPRSSDEDSAARCHCMANIHTMTDDVPKNLAKPERQNHEYLYKKISLKISSSQLPCGSTLLCVDAGRFPMILAESGSAHMVVAHEALACKLPTYWTLTDLERCARVLLPRQLGRAPPSAAQLTASDPAVGTSAEASAGGSAEHNKRPLCTRNHNFNIVSMVSSIQQIRWLLCRGTRLSLLNQRRGTYVPLRIQRIAIAPQRSVYGVLAEDANAAVLEELSLLLNRPTRRSSLH